ncbi:MAG: hypothetical protein ACNA7U_02420 [Candidatus Izemoplasmataceae bacterium]
MKLVVAVSFAIMTGFVILGVYVEQWGATLIIGAVIFVGVSLVFMQLIYAYYLFNMEKTRRQHEMKKCPHCEAAIYHSDSVCPYCKKPIV